MPNHTEKMTHHTAETLGILMGEIKSTEVKK